MFKSSWQFFNQKQRFRLGCSLFIVAIALPGVSLYTIQSMNRLAILTQKLYDHPFTVNTAVLRVEAGIISMHRSMKDVALANDPTELAAAAQKVDRIEQAVFEDFDLILAQFLGDKTTIEAARQKFAAWKPIRDRVIQLRQWGQIAEAAAITKGEGAEYIQDLLTDIDEVEIFAANKAAEFLEDSQQARQRIIQLAAIAIVLTSIAIVFWVIWMSRLLAKQRQAQTILALEARRSEALLKLPEIAETVDEATFLQRGQEFAEDLTDSQIAFIHFVNDDGESIELVAWSRRTLQHYCSAAYDRHYPVSRAGIWADALRQKKAVVFNDYATYPHKRGLPEGHAHLQRLISVPVIENGRVVMLTGVGNKSANYTDMDVDTVQLISNAIWRIVQRRRSRDKLAANERQLREAQHIGKMGSWELDRTTDRLIWSDEVFQIFEVSSQDLAQTYDAFLELVHPSDREWVRQTYLNSLSDRTLYDCTHRLLMPDGRIKYVRERCETDYAEDNRPQRSIGTIQDITDRFLASEKLQQAAAVFRSTLEGVVITDLQSQILDVNQAFVDITGYEREEAIGQNPSLLKSGRHDRAFYETMWQSLQERGYWRGEIWNRRKDGSVYPELLTITTVRDDLQQPRGYVGVFSDITKSKQFEEQLYKLAHHHPLTELPNRLLLNARLQHSLEQARRRQVNLAVLFIDLDRFKQINDSLGHAMGDLLLQQVADRLKQALRSTDTVAHLGGDEFVILLENTSNPREISPVAVKILELLNSTFVLRTQQIYISASIGISVYPDDSQKASELLRNADTAMYRAKKEGGNTYRFYTREMTKTAFEHILMENALRMALKQEQFSLVYQPQIDLHTQQWIGMEVLLRWQHPQLGKISPAQFIPIAEQNGMIRDIGAWVLQQACVQGRTWLNRGIDFGRISVNVAGSQIQAGNLPDLLAEILATTDFPTQHLELEVTESFIMQRPHEQIELLRTVRDMGIQLAIDDFGTGYSSLSYLKHLPIDKLKIDRSFVHAITQNRDDMAISEAVIALGKALELQILAEGVETEEQATFLRSKGCHQAQGYFYCKPVPSEAIPQLLLASFS
ncbi:MAG: EAL domain-containing protein [Spirulina sp.]